MSSYDKQIGGKHYQNFKIQPSKFVVENKLLFPEGCAIKYICRHPFKGGKEDLLKAIHYVILLMSSEDKDDMATNTGDVDSFNGA